MPATVNSNPPEQVAPNYAAFAAQLPELLRSHPGEFALMRDERIVGFFGSGRDAYLAGCERFGLGGFSVQEVTDVPADLGFFSHAVPLNPI